MDDYVNEPLTMLNQEEKIRYSRHLILSGFGEERQLLLKQAKVLVIGAGGLGSPVLQYLSAAGVGTIGIVDGDRVDISNLQRQVIFHMEDVGQNKAEAAMRRLSRQNSHVLFDVFPEFLDRDNALEIMQGYDVVVDGSDNFATRYLVSDACVLLEVPLVYGSIMQFEGQVSVFNYQGGPTYRCLFPEPPNPAEVPGCSEIGVLGVMPGLIGCHQANEVLKMITGMGEVLSGKLMLLDALGNTSVKLAYQRNEEVANVAELLEDYEAFCHPKPSDLTEISLSELKNQLLGEEPPFVLDVREPHEYDTQNIGGHLIPLLQLRNRFEELPKNRKIVVHCQSGVRSQEAIALLKQYGFQQLVQVRGGLRG